MRSQAPCSWASRAQCASTRSGSTCFRVSRHEDRPGVVGKVGSILGEHDVNIASMQVGRDTPRGNAMMILAVDDRVAPDVLSRLREVGGMSDLRYVELGTTSDG